jgi:chemotaxis protein MotB
MARRKEAAHGGHGWFVTFADLMGLLVSFFVMLVAFSNQDSKKVQAVTGSMREAFGVQKVARYSGIVETDGLEPRTKIKHAEHIEPWDSSLTPTPDKKGHDLAGSAMALAAVSLRQALQDLPELTEASKHVMIDESREGLNIDIVDQEGRSMFAEGSQQPYVDMRRIIEKLARPLTALPYRIAITGHTSGPEVSRRSDYDQWSLSVDRANSVRQILEEDGYPSAKIYKVTGKANTDPLFTEDPFVAPNRRVTVTLMREAPPLPADLQP